MKLLVRSFRKCYTHKGLKLRGNQNKQKMQNYVVNISENVANFTLNSDGGRKLLVRASMRREDNIANTLVEMFLGCEDGM
jgi:hypothetical protein